MGATASRVNRALYGRKKVKVRYSRKFKWRCAQGLECKNAFLRTELKNERKQENETPR
jgi:hypothetical protein